MKYLKSFSLFFGRLILKMFHVFPIKKNKIIFVAFDGRQYACNPKYIYKYIQSEDTGNKKLYWVFNEPEKISELSSENVRLIKNKTISYIYHMLTAQVIITNASLSSFLPLRKRQMLIETWHGGGAYKKTGRDIERSEFKDMKLKVIADEISGFISSSVKFTETKSKNHLVPKDKFWEIGMPRNDVLFNKDREIELNKKVRQYYGIDEMTKIVLYAPTLRNDKTDTTSYESLDVPAIIDSLSKRFEDDKWVVMFRMHYLLDPSKNISNTINVSDYNDSQELVCAADVLISDYSSIMWDFTFTERPCFVYAPDAEKYAKERAFFTPIREWPYPVAFNNNQLKEQIINFDQDKYKEEIKRHHREQGSFEKGTATEIVVSRINDWISSQN